MTRKVKPCVTIPYWKILQDREGERPEEEREAAKQPPQQETLLEVMGQAGRRTDARRADLRRLEDGGVKPEAREEEKSGTHAQLYSDDTLISDTFDGTGQPGPAWVRHSSQGWWWHQASGLLYSESDRKYFVWEELLQQHVEADPFHAPADEAGLSFRAEASSAGSPPGRSVVVRDLVAAGQALRTPLQHLDRPAALFALFQGSPGAESAEFFAKNLHAKLLRLLSQYRGFWSEELVRGAFQSALESLNHEFQVKHAEKARAQNCSCIAVLLLGSRVFAAALGDCQATLFRSRGESKDVEGIALIDLADEAGEVTDGAATLAAAWAGVMNAVGNGSNTVKAIAGKSLRVQRAPSQAAEIDSSQGVRDREAFQNFRFAACQLNTRQFPSHCLVLCAGGNHEVSTQSMEAGVSGRMDLLDQRALRSFLSQRRPRVIAGAVASQLRSKRQMGLAGGDPAAGPGGGGGSGSSSCSQPVIALAVDFKAQPAEQEDERRQKRPRLVEAAVPARNRCRHILLKHRELRQPVDAVRRRRVERSREEAEAMLRELLLALLADAGSFPQLARKHSECTTCLRGGDQAGDLGWLTRGARSAAGVSKEVEEAAFSLAVGELSDIVVSDAGVHLVQRIA